MSKSIQKLIDTKKLLTRSECVEIARKTLNQDDVTITNVELFGDETVIGFLGEYFRLVIYVADDAVSKSSIGFV